MDITFYCLLTLGSAVLLLAMWVCSSQSVQQWGPDLTLELPPHLLQQAFSSRINKSKNVLQEVTPSAPTDMDGAPLLSYAESFDIRKCPPPVPPRPPQQTIINAHGVRVLPPQFVSQHKLRQTPHSFTYEKPA